VAYTLNPSLDISQYAHTAWKIRDGFTKGVVRSIAQTPGGYLWLGTELGLLRFDGVRAVPWHPPADQQLPSNYIMGLMAAHDGTLWIGTLKGLASLRNGKLTNYPEVAGLYILALLEDHEGTIWVGSYGFPSGNLCMVRGGKMQCQAGSFGRGVTALYEDHTGNLWVSADTGVWRWTPGSPQHLSVGRASGIDVLIEADGRLLIATDDGLKQLVDGKIHSYAVPGVTRQFKSNCLFRSSDGSLWIGSAQGLLHLHQGRIDRFASANGLSGDSIQKMFEDREGDVWVSTVDGLDRFREFAVPTISLKQGLSNSAAWSVQATPDGSIWICTANGLDRWGNGHMTVYGGGKASGQGWGRDDGALGMMESVTKIPNSGLSGSVRSLGRDNRARLWVATTDGLFYFEGGQFISVPEVPGGNVPSIVGDGHGNVWVSNDDVGLFYWTSENAVQQIPWARLGRKYLARALLPDRDGLWLGFYEGGIAYLQDSQVRASYNAAHGLGRGIVSDLRLGSDGEIWVATEGGLSRVKDRRATTLTSKNGLPCDAVHWSIEDDDQAVWLYMPCGLVRIARSELDAWVRDSGRAVRTTVFDSADGVRSVGVYGSYGPHVTKPPDGKIWFVAWDGVSVIDPRHLAFNKIPPPVHIEQITADRNTYDPVSGQHLPPLIRDLEIDYTALSLVAPEKNRFKYKLEGRDRDWIVAGNRRQAFYTDLKPRSYRFRVVASNNSGVWNEAGASLNFSIDPAYYQTTWFKASLVAVFLAIAWGLYRLRLHQIAREFNARLEERVDERTRIARELHDTLLQSFHGLLPRLQAACRLLPGRVADARQVLEAALEDAAEAVTQARESVQGLRTSTTVTNDLANAIEAVGQGLALDEGAANGETTDFSIEVEGTPRDLHPILRDDIYRIVAEAVRNAFRHARARRIEVEIIYEAKQLRVRVRDNGIGIDASVLKQGRPGHFGLAGMRERATRIGGKLEVWSEASSSTSGAGTEIELIIPASMVYRKHRGRRFRLFKSKVRTNS
jgi:signal transduction histidine kinase/ligand-binding sensor domain-containing protein